MKKKVELAKKLKELSERGFDGEAKNAAEMLNNFCLKHGIDISFLESEAKSERRFQPKGHEHRGFMEQIISSTVGKRDTFRLVGKRNSPIIIEMTDAEFLETSVKMDFYWSDWLAQKEVFYSAYIQKQRLFRNPSSEKLIGDEPELSPDEIQRIKKLLSMCEVIEARSHRGLIEA